MAAEVVHRRTPSRPPSATVERRKAVASPPAKVADPAPAAEDRYRRALGLVKQRRFRAALEDLEAFLRSHADDDRVDRAQFWKAEVLFALEDYRPASEAYRRWLRDHVTRQDEPEVLLKLGICLERMGAPEQARVYLERLRARYPESEAARLARRKETG